MIPPLRKKSLKGELYTRSVAVEAAIAELSGLSRDDVVARCSIPRGQDGYVPSECLIYLVRARRQDNSDRFFERLYKLLMQRVLKALPKEPVGEGKIEALTNAKIREAARDRFTELLVKDRSDYQERLDYYEVRFDGAVANLRRDAQDKAWKEENRAEDLESDDSGEPTPEVEAAAAKWLANEDSAAPDYRSRLDAAIGHLKPEQIRIITMLRRGVQIHSETDPNAITIAKTLGRSEKTIRNQRDKAIAELKKLMGED